ncbi:MAG: hypothetical protein KF852_13745 [Saprospiraceae bacterium]|nr:hypothetical protein [Saprospiraceae bacterium]
MTADHLIKYLQHPEQLQRVSYQELKTLALEYPYCAHVHQLLLYKSRIAEQKDYPAILSRTAAHSIDRAFLRGQILRIDAAAQTASPPASEEVFELKPLSELEARLAGMRETIMPAEVVQTPLTAPEKRKKPLPSTENLSPDMPANEADSEDALPDASPALQPDTSPTPPAESRSDGDPEPIDHVEIHTPEPMSKSGFRSWKRLHTLTILPPTAPPAATETPFAEPEEKQTEAPETKDYSLPDLRDMADRSVEEKEAVASETLAALLARQGHTGKAIEMYERLCLIFPEKSAYFARQIQNLKNN